MQDIVKKYREELVEVLAEQEDELMEKFFAGEQLTEEELYSALRKGTLSMSIFPVLGGDSRTAVSKTLLDYITICLPSPLERPAVKGVNPKTGEALTREPSEEEPFSSLVFKIVNDPHVGTLSYFRIYSGQIQAGTYVLNSIKY